MAGPSTVGTVYLVGAGPGDPGLLTLRAAECLARADLVLYDRLVNPGVLEHVPQAAQRQCVADLPGPHAQRHGLVCRLLVEAARAGRTAVRLKGGDPLVFGRGAEEAQALGEAGVPYEIVPGVTAALAAGACAAIPLTHRDLASAVAFVTGHECPGKSAELEWAALARFPGTLVLYMAVNHLPAITHKLIGAGLVPTTPAAAVRWASTGGQTTVEGTLADIAARVAEAGLTAPAVVLLGPVVGLRRQLAWFEARPLFGRSVLVTRPRAQAAGMARRLEELGATVHTWPVLGIGPAPDPRAVDAVLGRLGEFDWLVFTSANGVRALLDRLLASGQDLRALGRVRLAAIGPRTAEALAAYHLRADLTPPEFRSESLAAALAPNVAGTRVLLARADRGREVLRDELEAVARVEQVAVYSQAEEPGPEPGLHELLRQGRIDFVTLTSANIARAFIKGLDDEARSRLGREVRLVTISPVTSAAAAELGYSPAAEATEYTTEGVVQAVLALAAARETRET